METQKLSQAQQKFRQGIHFFIFIACVSLGQFLFHQDYYQPRTLLQFLDQHPFTAPCYFVSVMMLASLAMVPTLPLYVVAGIYFGAVWGGVWSLIGATLGAALAFAIARGVFGQKLARRYSHQGLQWLSDEFEKQGWKVVAFVRLFPGFPAAPFNFIFGLTSLKWFTYISTTVIFLSPPIFALSVLGQLTGLSLFHKGVLGINVRLVTWGLVGFCILMILMPSFMKKTNVVRSKHNV